MSVAFCVPIDQQTLSGPGPRGAAWRYVAQMLNAYGWPMVVGLPPGDEWSKGFAVADAVRRTTAEVLVVHDADVVVHPDAITAAVNAVQQGAAWAVPHWTVRRYDEATTEALYAREHVDPTLTRWPYVGVPGGGIVVIGRAVYDDCPIDCRFVGWGGEDWSWGVALETLHGAAWRGDATLTHLWHPHATGMSNPQRPLRLESDRLRRHYRVARGRPEQMRVLVDAGRSTVVASREPDVVSPHALPRSVPGP